MPRVLIVKLSSLGDLFHALPAVHMIRAGLEAQIDWVTQPAYADLVRCFTDVDDIITFPRDAFFSRAPSYFRCLRANRYDVVVDLQGLLKSALLVSRLVRAPRRVGPSFSREGAKMFYTEVARPGGGTHAVELALDTVRHLGLPLTEPEFPVSFPVYHADQPGPHVAFIPCSRWFAKNWPAARFVELAARLQAERNACIHIIGGPGDEKDGADLASGLRGRHVNHCARHTLAETGGLLQAMDLVVSVDTGPMHMAAAVGTPVLAVFGPTDPARTGPYGNPHRVVQAEGLSTHPDGSRAFKRNELAGQWNVPVERVADTALHMLARKAP